MSYCGACGGFYNPNCKRWPSCRPAPNPYEEKNANMIVHAVATVADVAGMVGNLAASASIMKAALEEIVAAHLGDCPAAMDEVDFARAHNGRIRRIARDALLKSIGSAT